MSAVATAIFVGLGQFHPRLRLCHNCPRCRTFRTRTALRLEVQPGFAAAQGALRSAQVAGAAQLGVGDFAQVPSPGQTSSGGGLPISLRPVGVFVLLAV